MSRFGKLSDETRPTLMSRFSHLVENTFESLKNVYVKILTYGLRHKAGVLLLSLGLLIGSFALLPAGFIGFAFMPDTDQGEFIITLDMNPQVTVYQNNQITMQAEKIIRDIPEVERVYTTIGKGGSMLSSTAKNNITTDRKSVV